MTILAGNHPKASLSDCRDIGYCRRQRVRADIVLRVQIEINIVIISDRLNFVLLRDLKSVNRPFSHPSGATNASKRSSFANTG